jgi:hypothetical protein
VGVLEMRKILMLLLMGIFLISLASAESIGTWKQGDCVQLIQTCADCTYVKISSVINPDSTIALGLVDMQKDGTFYNYTFCNTANLGTYNVNGYGDEEGVDQTFAYTFEITPSGQGGTENIIFYIIVLVMVYGLALGGFFWRNEIITLFGSIPMFILGIVLSSQGLIIYQTTLTLSLGYISIGLGAYLSFMAGQGLWGD